MPAGALAPIGATTGVTSAGAAAMLSVNDSLQLAALIGGLVVIAVAGILSVRARSADLWRSAYEAEKALGDAKIKELADVRQRLSEATSKIAVFEQAPRYDDVAALFAQAVSQMSSEHHAMLDHMARITDVLSSIEKRLPEEGLT